MNSDPRIPNECDIIPALEKLTFCGIDAGYTDLWVTVKRAVSERAVGCGSKTKEEPPLACRC